MSNPIVKNGIDNIDNSSSILEGKRLGLITAPTGLTYDLKSTIDILNERFNLVALFAPEHGVRGDIQAGIHVETYIDEKTNIPVYSLYGGANKPTQEMMDKIDVIIMDIQDIGSRYYTFISTMNNAMEECAKNNKKLVLLDRLNPINGVTVEGNILKEEFKSFVGIQPIVQRHGMTFGELAHYFNSEFNIGCDIEVIEVTGWNREMYFEQSGLYWVNPSPNIPTIDTAIVYNGTCLFEGTNISEGRGTTKPFEIVGAPWINPDKLAQKLNDMKIEGVYFRPTHFTPVFSKHKNDLCKGIQLHITDRHAINSVVVGVKILDEIRNQNESKFEFISPNKGKYFIDLLIGSDELRKNQMEVDRMLENWGKQARLFSEKRKKYLLY